MIHYYFQFSYRGRCTGQKKNNTMWNSITFSVVFRADFLKDGNLTVHWRNGFALRIAKEGHWLCDWRNDQCYILEARYLEL